MSSSMLVLDANILIRAVLGNKVRKILTTYAGTVDFFTPDVCMADAQKYLPLLFEKTITSGKACINIASKSRMSPAHRG